MKNTNNNQFTYMGNRDIKTYYNWITEKTKNNENYSYKIMAAVDDYSVFDLLQFKIDTDGDFTQQYIELKGRYINFTDFPDMAIDRSKVEKLQKLSYVTGIPSYICAIYYPDSKICIWKIDQEKKYQVTEMVCQESQADPSRKGKIKKQMILLPHSKAYIYNF